MLLDTTFPLETEHWREMENYFESVYVQKMLNVLSDCFNDKFASLETWPDRMWDKNEKAQMC